LKDLAAALHSDKAQAEKRSVEDIRPDPVPRDPSGANDGMSQTMKGSKCETCSSGRILRSELAGNKVNRSTRCAQQGFRLSIGYGNAECLLPAHQNLDYVKAHKLSN
jgi:hypothetical protein